VLLWSSGFVVARYAMEDAGPLVFLAIRLAIAAVLLAVFAMAMRTARPTRVQTGWSAVVGILFHALYLGGVFVAISWGLAAGVSALISGLHPVLTAFLGVVLLRELLAPRQWLGIVLGFTGVLVVVVDKLHGTDAGLTRGTLIASVVSVVGMSAGTLVQRRFGTDTPLLWGTSVQYMAAAGVLAVAAALHEGEHFEVTSQSTFAMLWALLVLSIAAVLLMMWLLQREEAARVSSLFFLTPALSAAEAAILFDERLGPLALAGLVISLVGVALTVRGSN